MLQVGLIGLGDEWDQRFRPALERLRSRLIVRCVYTPVGSLTAQAANDLDCDAATGLVALLEREDVRAVLILDTDWHREIPVSLACQAGKAAFLERRLAGCVSRADRLLNRAADSGLTLMPDVGHRYTPVTSRLRELIATRLGRPVSLVVEIGPAVRSRSATSASDSGGTDLLAIGIDWCTSLVGTAPSVVAPIQRPGSGHQQAPREYDLEFRRPSAGGAPARASILVHNEPRAPGHSDEVAPHPVFFQSRIECAKGTALLEPPCSITWSADGELITESLTSDRADIDVMLDHFCRRVLGGLIPVPTLDDVRRARELAEEAWLGG